MLYNQLGVRLNFEWFFGMLAVTPAGVPAVLTSYRSCWFVFTSNQFVYAYKPIMTAGLKLLGFIVMSCFTPCPWPLLLQDIVQRMLTRDPLKRATADEVLSHEWVRENGVAGSNVIEPEVLKRLRGFAAMNRLKKEALKVSEGLEEVR